MKLYNEFGEVLEGYRYGYNYEQDIYFDKDTDDKPCVTLEVNLDGFTIRNDYLSEEEYKAVEEFAKEVLYEMREQYNYEKDCKDTEDYLNSNFYSF